MRSTSTAKALNSQRCGLSPGQNRKLPLRRGRALELLWKSSGFHRPCMPSHRNLKNPPIVEALIDIQVEPSARASVAGLEAMRDRLQQDYPVVRGLRQMRHDVTIANGDVATATQQLAQGFFFETADRTWVVQARRDGFAISRLAGYREWEELRQRAEHLWPIYFEAARPAAIVRMAVRYINRVEISLPTRLEDHFNLTPRIPPQLPQEVGEVFNRLVFRYPDGILAAITQASESGVPGTTESAVFLDIDVFSSATFAPEGREHWACLERLRSIKNEVFFSCLTETALKRFE